MGVGKEAAFTQLKGVGRRKTESLAFNVESGFCRYPFPERRPPVNVKEGDEVKSNLENEEFIVTKVVKGMVVLKSRRGERQILTGIDSLGMCYQKKATKLPG